MIEENSKKKDLKKRAHKPTDSKKEAVNLENVLSENENLKTEIRLLKLKNSFLQDPNRNKNLEIVINQLTKEIEDKNEVVSRHLSEIKVKDETISGFQKTLFIRDKEIKILKQNIKDINKKYNASEEMYEQVCASMEKCLADNEKLKLDLIQNKKPIVVEYRLFGFFIFSKTSN